MLLVHFYPTLRFLVHLPQCLLPQLRNYLFQKFKTAESKVQEQTDLVAALRDELEKSKASFLSEKDAQKKILADLEAAKAQVHDIQRSERVVRVDLEQSQKRVCHSFVKHVFAAETAQYQQF